MVIFISLSSLLLAVTLIIIFYNIKFAFKIQDFACKITTFNSQGWFIKVKMMYKNSPRVAVCCRLDNINMVNKIIYNKIYLPQTKLFSRNENCFP